MSRFGDMYCDFEDHFRGPIENVRERLKVYDSLLAAVPLELKKSLPVIDIGSGRGEWLKLLREDGWKCIGIEPNASMAKAAEALIGPASISTDGLTYLRQQADESAAAITAFHVVEHIDTEYLLALLAEIKRVLASDGIVILETPNVESLLVGSTNFYLDPTHKNPLPPELLKYFVKASGLTDCAIVRLNGEALPESASPAHRLLGLLFRSALDYSVVAQKGEKAAEDSVVRKFAAAVSQPSPADFSLLSSLVSEVDNSQKSVLEKTEAIEQQLTDSKFRDANFIELLSGVDHAVSDLRHEQVEQRERFNELTSQVAQLRQSLAERERALRSANSQIAALHGSTSWRVTAPLRSVRTSLSSIRNGVKSGARFVAEPALRLVRRYPALKKPILKVTALSPRIQRKLIHFSLVRSGGSAPNANKPNRLLTPAPDALTAWEKLLKNQKPNE